MKRAARLLLLALVGWVLALPLLRVERVRVLVRAPVAAAFERKAAPLAEHAVAESCTPRVAAAPLLDRLPLPPFASFQAGEWREPSACQAPRDLRQALRRVHARKRLPRVSSDDPPWC
jgi:hypothetical protein